MSLPGTQPKSPWPGHNDLAVNNKTVALMSVDGVILTLSVKVPVTGQDVLRLPNATPTGYGLGKSCWVSLVFAASEPVALDTLKRWMMESYRAKVPKRMLKELEAQ